MNKRIAVTGATGFVGRHLVERLISEGYEINALTRRPQSPCENINWIEGNFEDKAALSKLVNNTDVIIHVAGAVKAKNKLDFLNANAHSVSNLLTALEKQNNKPHFIQISSLAAREPQLSDYAFSKKKGEKIIIDNNLDLDWTIVRPPGIYGPHDMETLKIFKLFKWRIALYPVSKHNRASWVYVTDLVKYISHLINNPDYYGQTLEIDDGHRDGYSHYEFMTAIANTLKISTIGITVPKIILKLFGHTNDILGRIFGFAPMVSSKKVNEICHADWTAKNEHATALNQFHEANELKDGLKETLDWYRNNEYI